MEVSVFEQKGSNRPLKSKCFSGICELLFLGAESFVQVAKNKKGAIQKLIGSSFI